MEMPCSVNFASLWEKKYTEIKLHQQYPLSSKQNTLETWQRAINPKSD